MHARFASAAERTFVHVCVRAAEVGTAARPYQGTVTARRIQIGCLHCPSDFGRVLYIRIYIPGYMIIYNVESREADVHVVRMMADVTSPFCFVRQNHRQQQCR